MAINLAFASECAAENEDIIDRLRNFRVSYQNLRTLVVQNLDHSQGLIGYDFSMESLTRVMPEERRDEIKGLRLIPILDRVGDIAMLITAYDAAGNELFVGDKLLGDCCPQPPHTKVSRLNRLLNP